MKVLPIAYQKQWGVNYSINDKRRDFMSDNNKKVEEKAAEIIQATETQTVKPAAAEDKAYIGLSAYAADYGYVEKFVDYMVELGIQSGGAGCR